MATTKAVYDPVKAIEGMFNGSVTRIGYALKSPADYGGSTKTVLAECAKKFHDALDDCEIQLLDAKWYLEHQLRTNRLRREAKAREMGSAAKRKHDEIKESDEHNNAEETPQKKAKTEPKVEQKEIMESANAKEPAIEPVSAQSNGPVPETHPTKPQDVPNKTKPETAENPKDNQPRPQPAAQQTAQPTIQPPVQPAPPVKEAPKPPTKDQPTQDDFVKPTPQATPTGTNDDFNFESMFGEPTNDLLGGNKGNNDLDFFTTGDLTSGVDDARNQDPNSLDSLLPGLESYANQSDDPFLNINTTANDNLQNQNMPQSFSNDFGLPDLGTNIFDDFLNDDSLGGVGVGDGGNFEDNIDLSDAALLDMDFDSFQ